MHCKHKSVPRWEVIFHKYAQKQVGSSNQLRNSKNRYIHNFSTKYFTCVTYIILLGMCFKTKFLLSADRLAISGIQHGIITFCASAVVITVVFFLTYNCFPAITDGIIAEFATLNH